MSKTIQVDTEELGVVTVHKLALGDYAELLKLLKSLWPKIQDLVGKDADFSKMKNEDFIVLIPDLIQEAFPELMTVLAKCTDKTADDVSQLDLADAMELVTAAVQLNNYEKVVRSVKKLMALRKTPAPAVKAPVAAEQPPTTG